MIKYDILDWIVYFIWNSLLWNTNDSQTFHKYLYTQTRKKDNSCCAFTASHTKWERKYDGEKQWSWFIFRRIWMALVHPWRLCVVCAELYNLKELKLSSNLVYELILPNSYSSTDACCKIIELLSKIKILQKKRVYDGLWVTDKKRNTLHWLQ